MAVHAITRGLDIPLAGAAEDGDEPPSWRQLPQQVEHLCQRVGGVCVIDDHRKRLPLVDPSHAARHLRCLPEAALDVAGRQTDCRCHRTGADRVRHIEAADQRE